MMVKKRGKDPPCLGLQGTASTTAFVLWIPRVQQPPNSPHKVIILSWF